MFVTEPFLVILVITMFQKHLDINIWNLLYGLQMSQYRDSDVNRFVRFQTWWTQKKSKICVIFVMWHRCHFCTVVWGKSCDARNSLLFIYPNQMNFVANKSKKGADGPTIHLPFHYQALVQTEDWTLNLFHFIWRLIEGFQKLS